MLIQRIDSNKRTGQPSGVPRRSLRPVLPAEVFFGRPISPVADLDVSFFFGELSISALKTLEPSTWLLLGFAFYIFDLIVGLVVEIQIH